MENQVKAHETVQVNITPEVKKETSKRVNAIRKELGGIEKSMINIAFDIFWIHDTKSYMSESYQNIYDFAKSKFKMSRGTVHNYIKVVEKFAKREGERIIEEIDDRYKDFKYSQLIQLFDLTDEEISTLSPDLSVREMQKKVREMRPPELPDTEADAEDNAIIDVEATEINRKILFTVSTVTEYTNDAESILKAIGEALETAGSRIEISCVW